MSLILPGEYISFFLSVIRPFVISLYTEVIHMINVIVRIRITTTPAIVSSAAC